MISYYPSMITIDIPSILVKIVTFMYPFVYNAPVWGDLISRDTVYTAHGLNLT